MKENVMTAEWMLPKPLIVKCVRVILAGQSTCTPTALGRVALAETSFVTSYLMSSYVHVAVDTGTSDAGKIVRTAQRHGVGY